MLAAGSNQRRWPGGRLSYNSASITTFSRPHGDFPILDTGVIELDRINADVDSKP